MKSVNPLSEVQVSVSEVMNAVRISNFNLVFADF